MKARGILKQKILWLRAKSSWKLKEDFMVLQEGNPTRITTKWQRRENWKLKKKEEKSLGEFNDILSSIEKYPTAIFLQGGYYVGGSKNTTEMMKEREKKNQERKKEEGRGEGDSRMAAM